jgi:hypothetical protein
MMARTCRQQFGSTLAHRAEQEIGVSEKWIQFSAPNDVQVKELSIGWSRSAEYRFNETDMNLGRCLRRNNYRPHMADPQGRHP